jgi:adhesin transport system outer membrane protein
MKKIIQLPNYYSFFFLITLLSTSHQSLAITINEAIEDAIIHNPEFRQEVKTFRTRQAEVETAEGRYYPTIDLNAGIGYEEVNRPGINNEGDGLTRRETSIKLTQNLFEGFGTENEVYRQKYRLDSASFTAHAAANTVALKMATAYVNLIREKEILLLAEDNLDTHNSILQQIHKRYKAGISNQVEVDQAKARLALAQSSLGSTQNSYFDAFAKFQRVLGRKPDNALVKPKFTFNLPKTLEQATRTALINHPTLRSANADVADARAQYDSSNQNYYPTIDLEIEKTFDDNLSGVEGRNEYLQAMIRLKYNLYNGGRDSDNKERTVAEYHRSSEIRNNSRRQVIENLRFAWNARDFISEQIEFQNQHIKLTYETLTGYRKQFSLGRRSLLDLLNTESEHISATRTLINSKADLLIAKYRILSSTGNLIDELGIRYTFIAAEGDYQDE